MGMEYYLICNECQKATNTIEFSIVDHIETKHGSESDKELVTTWIPFLVKHSGHKIKFVDNYGRETNPTKINGFYVLGIEKKEMGK